MKILDVSGEHRERNGRLHKTCAASTRKILSSDQKTKYLMQSCICGLVGFSEEVKSFAKLTDNGGTSMSVQLVNYLH